MRGRRGEWQGGNKDKTYRDDEVRQSGKLTGVGKQHQKQPMVRTEGKAGAACIPGGPNIDPPSPLYSPHVYPYYSVHQRPRVSVTFLTR